MVGQDARRGQKKETSWSGNMEGFLEEGANLRRANLQSVWVLGILRVQEPLPFPCGRQPGGAQSGGNGSLPRVLPIPSGAPEPHSNHHPRYFPSLLSPCFSPFPVLYNRGQWLRDSGPQRIPMSSPQIRGVLGGLSVLESGQGPGRRSKGKGTQGWRSGGRGYTWGSASGGWEVGPGEGGLPEAHRKGARVGVGVRVRVSAFPSPGPPSILLSSLLQTLGLVPGPAPSLH